MPIYFDNDYKIKLPEPKNTKIVSSRSTNSNLFLVAVQDPELREIYHKDEKNSNTPYRISGIKNIPVTIIEKTAKAWVDLQKHGYNQWQKNERLIEVT